MTNWVTDLAKGVNCRATSIAKNIFSRLFLLHIYGSCSSHSTGEVTDALESKVKSVVINHAGIRKKVKLSFHLPIAEQAHSDRNIYLGNSYSFMKLPCDLLYTGNIGFGFSGRLGFSSPGAGFGFPETTIAFWEAVPFSSIHFLREAVCHQPHVKSSVSQSGAFAGKNPAFPLQQGRCWNLRKGCVRRTFICLSMA